MRKFRNEQLNSEFRKTRTFQSKMTPAWSETLVQLSTTLAKAEESA
jgi:hypothetical protein